MGQRKNTDSFGRVQDLILDLVFESWTEESVLELRKHLLELGPKQHHPDTAAIMMGVVNRVEELAELGRRLESEMDPDRAAKITRQLADGHMILINRIKSEFNVPEPVLHR